MMIYICTKFHENILNRIRVKERTRKVNRQTDGLRARHMARLLDGRIKMPCLHSYLLKGSMDFNQTYTDISLGNAKSLFSFRENNHSSV